MFNHYQFLIMPLFYANLDVDQSRLPLELCGVSQSEAFRSLYSIVSYLVQLYW